jgi:AsmA-like protein
MAGSWYRSRGVRVGGAIALLLLIVAGAIPFLVPVDRFRPVLVRLLEDSTGRTVGIDALRLYLVPTVHIRASNVRIRNPVGFPPGDTILARSIDLGLAPRALLGRKLDVTHIALSGVRLSLLHDPAGRTNFTFTPPPRGASAGGAVAPAAGASLFTLDRIGAVTVKNVEITDGTFDGRRGHVTPSFSLWRVNGRIRGIDPKAPDWTRNLTIDADVRGARLALPSLAKPVQFRAGTFLFTGGAGRGTFTAVLDTMRAEVTAAVASLDPLSITFTMSLGEFDINRLQALVISSPAGGGGSRAAPQAPPSRRPPFATGEVTIDRLVLPPLAAARVTSRLSVDGNAVQVVSYTLSAYRGSVRGKATLDYSAPDVPATVTAQVSGVDLRQVMSTLAPSAQRITGALDGTLTLSTAFGQDPLAALKGAGLFAVRNGSFPGLSLRSSLAQMAKALQLNAPAGPTHFSYFGGDLRISQERVYSNALRLDADDLEGTATGSFGFNTTLNYTGTGILKTATASPSASALPSVAQMLGATQVRVPFSLGGTVSDPKFSLAGTPQFLRGQTPQQPGAPQPTPLFPQDLLKLFH